MNVPPVFIDFFPPVVKLLFHIVLKAYSLSYMLDFLLINYFLSLLLPNAIIKYFKFLFSFAKTFLIIINKINNKVLIRKMM